MGKITTVADGCFSVEDITHRPKRMQGDNIRASERHISTNNAECKESSRVPRSVILERAIEFYESCDRNSEYYNLFSATASWLRLVLASEKKFRSDSEDSKPDDTLIIE